MYKEELVCDVEVRHKQPLRRGFKCKEGLEINTKILDKAVGFKGYVQGPDAWGYEVKNSTLR